MAAEEFDFPLDDVVEGDSAVVDVVVAAFAAVKFCLGCAVAPLHGVGSSCSHCVQLRHNRACVPVPTPRISQMATVARLPIPSQSFN
jgi:hypothetical protein